MDKQAYLQEIMRVIENGRFKPDWESLSQYQVPKWYENAKLGIFIHYGVYTVPEFGSEWYPRNMYIQGSREFEYHMKTYGPHKEFGYKDFVPLFKAERFNPTEWAELFKNTGARYVVPVAEHHDGFQMYQSDLSHWNAYEMGPKRNIIGDLKTEVEKQGLVFGASSHRAEHWFFLGHGKEFDSDIKDPIPYGHLYWPSMPEPNHFDLYSPSPSKEYLEDWLLRCCELVDKYQPKIVYFDWWIIHSAFKPYLKLFAAYYYNRADEWGTEVVINYKHDAFAFNTAVVDIERGQFAEAKPFVWQTDTSVARNSWSYTKNNNYKSSTEILCDFVDIVSKNGRLLLNIGPKADGSIPDEDRRILEDIGSWMKVNGEAIHDTKPWKVFGEGPTLIKEGQFTDYEQKHFTSQDIRFTVKGNSLYVFVLKYPEDGNVTVKSLGSKHFLTVIKDISVLGFDEKPTWQLTSDALVLNTKTVKSDKPVVFKLQLE